MWRGQVAVVREVITSTLGCRCPWQWVFWRSGGPTVSHTRSTPLPWSPRPKQCRQSRSLGNWCAVIRKTVTSEVTSVHLQLPTPTPIPHAPFVPLLEERPSLPHSSSCLGYAHDHLCKLILVHRAHSPIPVRKEAESSISPRNSRPGHRM
jgi:hypothetical protein